MVEEDIIGWRSPQSDISIGFGITNGLEVDGVYEAAIFDYFKGVGNGRGGPSPRRWQIVV